MLEIRKYSMFIWGIKGVHFEKENRKPSSNLCPRCCLFFQSLEICQGPSVPSTVLSTKAGWKEKAGNKEHDSFISLQSSGDVGG
jgi:hypothetical protein